jgi:hypothetical protein
LVLTAPKKKKLEPRSIKITMEPHFENMEVEPEKSTVEAEIAEKAEGPAYGNEN